MITYVSFSLYGIRKRQVQKECTWKSHPMPSEVAKQMGTTATAISINSLPRMKAWKPHGSFKSTECFSDDTTEAPLMPRPTPVPLSEAAKNERCQVSSWSVQAPIRNFWLRYWQPNLDAGYAFQMWWPHRKAPSPFIVKRTAFSNKGFAHTRINTPISR